jgi:F420-dependent oxidoreductase-like protein
VTGATRGLEVGLMVEGQEGVTWAQWRELAVAAENHGFSGLYRSDHYLSERVESGRDSLEAWGTVCALSAITSRIRLGTLVSPASFRHPSVLAKLVATADHVSGGRVELGMGAGWFEDEHLAYGFDFGTHEVRMDVLEEQVEIIKRSWQEEAFSFEGEHYKIVGLDARPKPLQQCPRLIVGGHGGRRGIALAARWADEYNSPEPTDEQIRERRAALTAECARIGRDPVTALFSIVTSILTGTDSDGLEKRAVRVARFRGEDHPDSAATLAHLPKTWLVGEPSAIVERLRTLAELGCDRVMLCPPLHDDLEMIELIGREVLPALRESGG